MLETNPTEPWMVSKASDGFRLFADCVQGVGIEGLGKDADTVQYYSPTGTAPQLISISVIRCEGVRQWRVRVVWPGAASLEHLDIAGKCRGCGHEIIDAKVTDRGSLLIGHLA
jgi:hypothetical protein